MKAESSKFDPPKRKRLWYQFSLRTLLIVTIAVAIGCAWLELRAATKSRTSLAKWGRRESNPYLPA
jgi:hypothetical protein